MNRKLKKLRPVILCGGSGERLWPLSRSNLPKQFIEIDNKKTLFDLCIERVKFLRTELQSLVLTAYEYRFLVSDSLIRNQFSAEIICEPVKRNTAAAFAVGASFTDDEEILIFLPSDHLIPNLEKFKESIFAGIDLLKDDEIVTFGIKPKGPNSGYGYIKVSEEDGSSVLSFVEKPDMKKAEELILNKNYFWNSGIYLVKSGTLKAIFNKLAKDIYDNAERALSVSKKKFEYIILDNFYYQKSRSESIDNALVEKYHNIKMATLQEQWSDMGSWSTFSENIPKDINDNRRTGNSLLFDTRSTLVYAKDKFILAMGVEDLTVVDSDNAVLVMSNHLEKDLKEYLTDIHKLRPD